MRASFLRPALAALALAVLAAGPLRAQRTVGVSFDYMGYSFEEGLGANAAQLLMVPLAVRYPVTDAFVLDLYSAWAQGRVERDDVAFTLQGLVDTRVKASYQATPWALLSVGANLPTGNATHDGEEAVVASVLAADLLGFREATWGTGLQVTSSVATAVRAGQFGIGFAGAYSVNGEFEPEQALRYQPGNEVRFRVGVDSNIGTNTLTLGGTFMSYSEDQAEGRNLFQAGQRMRFDATYAFRAGAGVWTLYAADLWRENGDLTLPFVDDAGAIVGEDTTLVTPSQNLLVAGLVGTVGAGGAYIFRPQVDVKLQSRSDVEGGDEGSGWVVAVGGDFPVRLFGAYDFFPKARVLVGSVKDPTGVNRSVRGMEFTATVRWGF